MDEAIYTAYLAGSLKLSRSGEWVHNGKHFTNPRLIELFHRSIFWDSAVGSYFIRIGKQQATFDLEDTAYFVEHLDDSKNPWILSFLDGSTEELDPKTLRMVDSGEFYCQKLNGQQAKFRRGAHQRLLEHATGEDSLEICGETFKIPRKQ